MAANLALVDHMNTKPLPQLTSVQQLLFEVPLYAPHSISDDLLHQVYGLNKLNVDGYCLYCGREATFKLVPASIGNGSYRDVNEWVTSDTLQIVCARDELHKARFWFFLKKGVIQKVGQFPSLADIANEEVKVYRKLLSPEMASEFHKAVGLAAHGVGVGSYVYLRRVFEWMINGRFNEFKDEEGWSAEEFKTARMDDKIAVLKDHLPEFLVANRRVYTILSMGIHELSEEQCLGFFDILKRSIVMMLEDDTKKREERERRDALARAIASFKAPMPDEVGHS